MSSEARPESCATTAASDREARNKAQLAEALAEVGRLQERAKVANQERLRCLEATRQLKGSIRIMGRIRPPVQGETSSHVLQPLGAQQLQVLTEPRALLTERRTTSTRTSGCQSFPGLDQVDGQAMDSRIFFFDDLFDSQATDDEIFTSVQDELDAAVAGEAVCILAYGATGSGKTHTVTNLAHRAAVELERQATALANGGMKLEITVQLVEIYNDQLRDLLAEGEQPRLRLSVSSSGSALLGAVSQQITADSNGGIAKMLGQVLRIGQAQRATFNTALNVRSSRSHLVMMLFLGSRDMNSGHLRSAGKLSFVDLAGSERLKRSEAVGERRREAQHINRSLSALADVISAKERRVAHVPFRNSKLTQLLQDALGGSGQCRTVVFVTLPPTRENLNDTLHSLQFSQRLTAIALPPLFVPVNHTRSRGLDGPNAWQRIPSASMDDRQLMLEVSHWRQEFEKAQAQRDAFRSALEEKDRELQEERRRNAELLAEANARTPQVKSSGTSNVRRGSPSPTATREPHGRYGARPITTREANPVRHRPGGTSPAGRRPSPVLRGSRSAEPVPSAGTGNEGRGGSHGSHLPPGGVGGGRRPSPASERRPKVAPVVAARATSRGATSAERPVRPSWAAPLQELVHAQVAVAPSPVVPRVVPPSSLEPAPAAPTASAASPPARSQRSRSGSPPRPFSPNTARAAGNSVPVFALSPRALAWPDGGSPSPEVRRHESPPERPRSLSLGRRGPVPQKYCVEVISDAQASKLTGRPVEKDVGSPRHKKCPPSPALLLCPTEVIDDTEDIGDGTFHTEVSDVSASSDEGQIRDRLTRCLQEAQNRRRGSDAKREAMVQRSSRSPRNDPMSKTVPAWSWSQPSQNRGRDNSRSRRSPASRYAPVLSQRSLEMRR